VLGICDFGLKTLRQSQISLTWPKGPGFSELNKQIGIEIVIRTLIELKPNWGLIFSWGEYNLGRRRKSETFEKFKFLFEFKEGENFNHRHTFSIPRIELKLHFVQNVESDAEIGQKGVFCKGLIACCSLVPAT